MSEQGWLLVERGIVLRVLQYSDGRTDIEVRGQDTDSLYRSQRSRYDRRWTEGELVDVYRPSTKGKVIVSLDDHRESFRLSFHPADQDHSEGA